MGGGGGGGGGRVVWGKGKNYGNEYIEKGLIKLLILFYNYTVCLFIIYDLVSGNKGEVARVLADQNVRVDCLDEVCKAHVTVTW